MQSPFHALGASDSVVAALARRGITEPFPIQSAVLGDALAGRDVVAQSPTGSGKTLAFAIPLVERATGKTRNPEALVLSRPASSRRRSPARSRPSPVRARCASRWSSAASASSGQGRPPARSDVVVATPGRLEDLVARRLVRLDDVSMLVLDEVDRMLDVGFKPAVERIVALLPRRAPDAPLLRHARRPGRRARGEVTRATPCAPRRPPARPGGARRAPLPDRREGRQARRSSSRCSDGERGLALVFVRTKHGAGRLAQRLERRGVRAVALHGDMSQNAAHPLARALLARRTPTPSWRPTSPPAASTSTASRTSSTSIRRTTTTRTSTASAAPAAPGKTGTGMTFVLDDQRARVAKMAAVAGIDARCERTREYLDEPTKPQRREMPVPGPQGREAPRPQSGGGPRRSRRGPPSAVARAAEHAAGAARAGRLRPARLSRARRGGPWPPRSAARRCRSARRGAAPRGRAARSSRRSAAASRRR